VGKQKSIPQSKKRGKRLNILGKYEANKSLNYALALGSFRKDSFIKILDVEAQEAENHLAETGVNTVIILDNYSVHRNYQVKAKEKEWQDKGLYLFFLPTQERQTRITNLKPELPAPEPQESEPEPLSDAVSRL
jgi:hypothetical protein